MYFPYFFKWFHDFFFTFFWFQTRLITSCEVDPVWHPQVSLWTVVKWLRVAFILPENLVRMGLISSASEILRFSLTWGTISLLKGGSVEATNPSILVKWPFATEFFFAGAEQSTVIVLMNFAIAGKKLSNERSMLEIRIKLKNPHQILLVQY